MSETLGPPPHLDGERALRLARETFSIEAAAVQGLSARTGEHFVRAVAAMLRVRGRVLDSGVEKEACPMNLAPTASTTAQLALGDALAVALLDARGFRAEDFARSHPGGALGRQLLTHVADVMRTGEQVPQVPQDASFSDLMREVSRKGLGASAVVDNAGRPVGIFTDGDLRRLIEKGGDLRGLVAREVMHPQPRVIAADVLAVQAAALMETHRITSVLVVDAEGRLCGAVNTNDLMRAKVI
jgi:arabinose-5-phosphate isomerase